MAFLLLKVCACMADSIIRLTFTVENQLYAKVLLMKNMSNKSKREVPLPEENKDFRDLKVLPTLITCMKPVW